MRKIKFRAWDKGNNKMIQPFHEWKVFPENVTEIREIFPSSGTSFWIADIMQFTGLHDKNGKEIYEGDIIKDTHGEEILKVFFNTSMGQWDIEFMGGDCEELVSSDGWDETMVEIIGNIYENPDLFKADHS